MVGTKLNIQWIEKHLHSGLGFRKWAKESKNFLEVSLAPDSASNWS